jgi:putative chitinase
MLLTEEQLKRIYPSSTKANRAKYYPWLVYYMSIYKVDTYERICAFLAQVGHESGQLNYVKELASGQDYEGRKDLGNIHKGDGVRYKGRGLIQVTGRANYTALNNTPLGLPLTVDFVEDPELLTEPQFAVLSAFWYWDKHKLNQYATLKDEDFRKLTRKINGGYNGYANRVEIWNRAKKELK